MSQDVVLTQEQIERTRAWVQAKQSHKQAVDATDLWYDQNSDSLTVDLMGRLGEIAAAIALDLDWEKDLDWSIKGGGDTGADLVANGYAFDVKTTVTSWLIFNSRDHFKAPAAVLVQLLGDRTHPDEEGVVYRVHGVCSKARFLRDAVDRQFSERHRVAIPASEMTPVGDFIERSGQ